MAVWDAFKGLFRKSDERMVYAKLIDGTLPLFSQFGRDVYASDVVQMAVDCIATEISKLQPRHIRTDPKGIQTIPQGDLNRLFRVAPNPMMTTRDFLEKIIWQLYMNYNCFIYPAFDVVTDARGNQTRKYTALFPLNPTMVTFLQDASGRLFVKMDFAGAESFTLPYSDVIHLRKRFSVNSIMGGGANGQPDNQALLKVLEINNTISEGLAKAVKTSLGVRGLLKINTMLDEDKQKAERKRFEDAIASSSAGILTMDLKGDYVDLKPDPKVIDKDTMAFVENKVLYWYGVPLKILSGDFNDEAYQAWYEKTLEPLMISLGQAFSRTLFTDNELSHGNEIVFFPQSMMYLSTASKLKLLEVAGAQGLLTDDQKLAVLGYPPLLDGSGSRRTISLNFISTQIVDEYQMQKGGDDDMTLNEKRKKKGLPALPGGDAIYMPATMIAAIEADDEEDEM
jgi:HK97 family phage portal protein